jgi:hypothetical protein
MGVSASQREQQLVPRAGMVWFAAACCTVGNTLVGMRQMERLHMPEQEHFHPHISSSIHDIHVQDMA